MGIKYSYFFIIYQICNFSIWTHACIWYNKIRREISLLCIKVPLYKIFSFSSLILKYFCHNMYYQNRTSNKRTSEKTTFPHKLSDLYSILQVTPCMTCLFAAEDYNDPASSTSPPPPACAPMLAVLSVTDLLQSDLFILCTLFTMYLQCIYNVCHWDSNGLKVTNLMLGIREQDWGVELIC